MLTCCVCGYQHKTMIHFEHIRGHGLTTAEYKEKYPGAKLRIQSEESKAKTSLAKKGVESPFKGAIRGKNEKLSEVLRGKSRPNAKGKKRTDEQRKLISERTKEAMTYKFTNDVRQKMSDSVVRRKEAGTYVPPMLGKTLSEEARSKISSSLTGDNNWARQKFNDKIESVCQKENLQLLARDVNTLHFKCNACRHDFNFSRGYFTESQISRGHALGEKICPACNPRVKTKSEKELKLLDFIRSIYPGEVKSGVRSVIFPMELDIFIPDKNLAIEFNGLYWHSENVSLKQNVPKYRDYEKYLACKERGIRLISIFEDEWDMQQSIVEDRLSHILKNKSITVGARKCAIAEISFDQKKAFLKQYHIQGSDRAKHNIGAFFDGELVAVMTFSPTTFVKGGDGSQTELNRFAIKSGLSIPGIASRLLKFYMSRFNVTGDIISYSDNRWSQGHVYETLGFKFASYSKPSYFYINMKSSDKSRLHRSNFMKHRLEKIFGRELDLSKSEWELMQEMGYDRIWDCGTTKWIFNK